MSIRKIGVVGSFAAGVAFALAPLAAAETSTDTSTGTFDFSDVLVTEVKSMNFLFEAQAALAGVKDADIVKGAPTDVNPLSFDVMKAGGPLDNETFAHLIYGIDPEKAGESSLTGSYNLFNGAVTQFADANNVLLYALLNKGAEIDPTKVDVSDFLFGSDKSIDAALGGGGVFADFGNFFMNGVNDVMGYLDLPSIDV